MSEREVLGFSVAADRLWALVGSGQDPDDLLGKEPGAVADLDFHLAHTWPGMTTAQLAGDVLAGRLDEQHAGDVTRVLVPLLGAVGIPVYDQQAIWLQETMALAWRPVFTALGLTTLAGLWETSNVAWPWPRGTQPRSTWPVVTELAPPALAAVAAEFGALTGSGGPEWQAALPDAVFVDTDGDPLDDIDDAREELAEHLDLLAAWVARVPAGDSLILVMDGDQ
ncbi:hypothetical protein AB0K00_15590 [Dactylosporangium sp. NPDC049525]|uniref:hypothetical protein n=1 Tax=Dactylosporangium sp. NPDC049525 TaxID=3154730 RepID=UPI0034195C66